MEEKKGGKEGNAKSGFTRRDFLRLSKNVALGTLISGTLPGLIWLDDAVVAIPASGGYLLVDTKKCQGCMTCMLACSLVHEGQENLSLARIQVIENPFERFPDDISIEQCRQCVEPACLAACPTGALHVDGENGNVRRVDAAECIGCMRCVRACAYPPSRAIWNFKEGHSQKCDLCVDTPHWNEKGGPDGKQACVELCPVGAISFTSEIPAQEGDVGYNVNLRESGWSKLGYTTD
jgi:protein NrfC